MFCCIGWAARGRHSRARCSGCGAARLATQPLAQRFQRLGAAEEVALAHVAAQALQEGVLAFGFHAFGHHGQAQVVGQADGGGADGGVVGVGFQVFDKGAVELEAVQRQALEVGERGVAGAEVI